MAERGTGGQFVKKDPNAASTAPSNDLAGATNCANLTPEPIDVGAGLSVDLPIAQAAMPDAGTPEYERAIQELRARRRVFGASTQKLALPERRGYHRHWFNDVPGRIDDALGNGWAHVVGRDRKPVCRVVGTGRDSNALRAYAMELPLPIWEEDQAARHRDAKDRVDAIKGAGAFRAPQGAAKPSDKGKFYSPTEEPVKMGESLVKS